MMNAASHNATAATEKTRAALSMNARRGKAITRRCHEELSRESYERARKESSQHTRIVRECRVRTSGRMRYVIHRDRVRVLMTLWRSR